jgi:hypothetical protein
VAFDRLGKYITCNTRLGITAPNLATDSVNQKRDMLLARSLRRYIDSLCCLEASMELAIACND